MSTTAINDADEWQQLSANEQSEILQEGLQTEYEDEPGIGDIPRWEDTDEATQEQTLAAIEGALAETWTALCFEDYDRQTIPFEIHELTGSQQEELMEWMQVFGVLQEAEAKDIDELREEIEDTDEILDKLDRFEDWMHEYLAEITNGATFDPTWWATADYPSGLETELVKSVVMRYNEQFGGVESFR